MKTHPLAYLPGVCLIAIQLDNPLSALIASLWWVLLVIVVDILFNSNTEVKNVSDIDDINEEVVLAPKKQEPKRTIAFCGRQQYSVLHERKNVRHYRGIRDLSSIEPVTIKTSVVTVLYRSEGFVSIDPVVYFTVKVDDKERTVSMTMCIIRDKNSFVYAMFETLHPLCDGFTLKYDTIVNLSVKVQEEVLRKMLGSR